MLPGALPSGAPRVALDTARGCPGLLPVRRASDGSIATIHVIDANDTSRPSTQLAQARRHENREIVATLALINLRLMHNNRQAALDNAHRAT